MLAADMAYCGPRGIPRSLFAGRVVRPGVDPGWTAEDRALALAWQADKAATCGGCGTRADEWAADEDAYYSAHAICEGCARLAEEQERNLDRGPDGRPAPGQHVYLTPVPPPPPDAPTPAVVE